MVKAINAYLARPGAVILSPLEAKGRLTQLSSSKFPTVPFTIVPGKHPCCTLPPLYKHGVHTELTCPLGCGDRYQ